MIKKYININNLSISQEFYDFINNEALPGTDLNQKNFWKGLSKVSHELSPKNRELLKVRKRMQLDIDRWHLENYEKEFNHNEYKS